MKKLLLIIVLLFVSACSNSQKDAITMSKSEYNELLNEIAVLEDEFNKTFEMRVSMYTKAEADEELSLWNGQLYDLQEEYESLKKDGKTCSLTNFDNTLFEANDAINQNLVDAYIYENTIYILYPNGRCLIGELRDDVMVFTSHSYETTTDEILIDNEYNYIYDDRGINGFKKIFK